MRRQSSFCIKKKRGQEPSLVVFRAHISFVPRALQEEMADIEAAQRSRDMQWGALTEEK